MFAVAAFALINDTETSAGCDIQVANKNGTALCTTEAGARVRYLGHSNQTFGSSGTGTFNPFVRLQGSPTEAGYNTNGTTEFETKVGTWTHAIKISEMPVRTEDGCSSCWELFVDINDSNNNKGRLSQRHGDLVDAERESDRLSIRRACDEGVRLRGQHPDQRRHDLQLGSRSQGVDDQEADPGHAGVCFLCSGYDPAACRSTG
jgi:hypothetical protein